jgi:1-acyl-sn-glycerol-3-phosphate acyltransferase
MQWLRSVLFFLGMALSAIAVVAGSLFVFPLPYRFRYRYLSTWSRFNLWWLAVTCKLTYRVEGSENIPAGPAVVLAKHQSAWETLAMQQVFPPQTWVLKRELLWIPIFGWGLALMRPVAIDRSAGKKALRQVIDQGRARLAQGLWMIVFPEGTRTAPGQRGRYAVGGAMLADKAGVPVVPVAHNAGEFWPKSGFLKRPGVIRLVIGPVIPADGRGAGEINREAETWIETTVERLRAQA